MLNVIAFDAARRCTGYAYKNQAGGWVTGTFNIFEHDKIIRVIKEACMDGVTHAAIEDCYLKNSVSTLKALQDAQSRIAQRCEDAGLLWTPIKAITWQSAYGISAKHGDTKIQAAKMVRLMGAGPYKTTDENDAVILCDYATHNAPLLEWHGKGGRAVK